jgi:hypothetical protein
MSRIHAFLIAIFVTGAVAVGAATAFTVANSPKKPGSALSTEMLQARAKKINDQEKKLAKRLKENPEPDTSPITKVVTVGGSSGSSSSSTSGSSSSRSESEHTSTTTTTHRESEDHHSSDHDDHSEDHSGSGHGGDDD